MTKRVSATEAIITRVRRNVRALLSLSYVKLLNREDAAMDSTDATHDIPADVRAAIRAFLNACQKEARPFATSEALGAVRRVFPDLDISAADLLDAIISEASTSGFDVGADAGKTSNTRKQKSLERWDNEGGAIGKPPRADTQRSRDNDTSGARRRAKETKDRNDLT
jgi:hypothetical protein